MSDLNQYMFEINTYSIAFRIVLSVVLASIAGYERSLKRYAYHK